MDELFADERIRFFLRNRADIKAWAQIESDVMAATRELLARAEPRIEEAFAPIEPAARISRHDGGSWERIFVQRENWPSTVALCVEWHRSVDPTSNAPKIGVFWWAEPSSLVEPRTRFITLVDKSALQRLGYKVPLEGVWPVGTRAKATPDWWHEPEAWITSIVESLRAAWPLIADSIDIALRPVTPEGSV